MTYDEIIDQTYITPIRSVIAVDDEFPTLDGVLTSLEKAASDQDSVDGAEERGQEVTIHIKAREVARASEVLKYCRAQQWMVDVHDGRGLFPVKEAADNGLISHLHQTDLLILDYQLEGEAKGGDAAIRILRSLVLNKHFNLVVVYTKKDATEAFREIMLALLAPAKFVLEQELADRIGDSWDDWIAADQEAMTPFEELVDIASYLAWRDEGAKIGEGEFQSCFPAFDALSDVLAPKIAVMEEAERFTPINVLSWMIRRFEGKNAKSMGTSDLESVYFAHHAGDDVNWIWTESLYLTVISKSVEGAKLIEGLKRALYNWRPTPHHILLSKMRALLEDSGGEIEAKALRDEHVQAGLLWELLEPRIPQRQTLISRVLDRQWGEVLDAMKEKIVPEALELIDITQNVGETRLDAVGRYYPRVFDPAPPAKNFDVWLRLNSYWSSVPPGGYHLGIGHVFEFEEAHWLCLSPSCDLVPEQSDSKHWRERIGAELHFKAVKLHPVEKKDALKYAMDGVCVYLRVEDEIRTFGFTDPKNGRSNPDWEQMFALDKGKFESGHKFKLRAVRADAGGLLLSETTVVTVVGQLRYEYALNLLQRLGNNLSRIGLDFVRPN